MSGITSAINAALSGLELFEAGIATVSNNLANAAAPGYAAESVTASTAAGTAGQPGDGVQAPQIIRAASGFAAALLRTANAAAAAASAQSTSLTTISNALTNNGDVQTAINQFFQDISTLAANPSSAAQRQTVLADAQTITGSFASATGVIDGAVSGATQTLSQSVSSANNLLGQLATINEGLIKAPNSTSLLDQQQAALNSLSSLIPVSAITQSNGSIILASGGTILLDQSGAQDLRVSTATPPGVTAGNNNTEVALTAADGTIGASVATAQAGATALNGLNAFAAIFANSVNTAQAEGLTPTGAAGGSLFSVPDPTVAASAHNTGTASITAQISNSSALPTDGGPFLLTYATATGWSATDQASGTTYTGSGTPPRFAGLTINVTGGPSNGDQFVLNPAPNAATGIAVAATNANEIAAADPYVATAGTLQSDGSILNNNGGVLTPGADTVTAAPNSDAAVIPSSYFGQNLQLTFTSPTAYNVTTSADPSTTIATGSLGAAGGNIAVAYPAGAASGNYWQLPITGTPTTGDVLTLTPGGSSSGSNATRLAALWTATGTTTAGTLQQAIIGFGTALGATAQQAQQLSTATATTVTTASANLQTVSGVSSDQQAVALTNYQQAYQAAAQAISAAHTMFESLISAI